MSQQNEYRFKYEYGNEESPSQRYEREYKEGREKYMKMGRILTEKDKNDIRTIIINNFTERNEQDILNETFINRELRIVVKHVKNRHSHHMDTLYSYENILKIKSIAKHKSF